jgi:hypothetical protein
VVLSEEGLASGRTKIAVSGAVVEVGAIVTVGEACTAAMLGVPVDDAPDV